MAHNLHRVNSGQHDRSPSIDFETSDSSSLSRSQRLYGGPQLPVDRRGGGVAGYRYDPAPFARDIPRPPPDVGRDHHAAPRDFPRAPPDVGGGHHAAPRDFPRAPPDVGGGHHAAPRDFPRAPDGRGGARVVDYEPPPGRRPLAPPRAAAPDHPLAPDGVPGFAVVEYAPRPLSSRSRRSGSAPHGHAPRGNSREALAAVAAETVTICQNGFYVSQGGLSVNIHGPLHACIHGTTLYERNHEFALGPPVSHRAGRIEVTPESVFACARRLSANGASVAVLNFASPIKPGGGFLNGAQAQEEAIARASGLYPSILPKTQMYEFGRSDHNPLYSDYMIYSPGVPYFRDDEHRLLDVPFYISVITAAAPNAKECVSSQHRNAIPNTIKNRLRKVIKLAALMRNNVLVLGAFGCGVYGNDPALVARYERELLVDEGLRAHFDVIANPIVGGAAENFAAFQRELARY